MVIKAKHPKVAYYIIDKIIDLFVVTVTLWIIVTDFFYDKFSK